jgi:hypothetical protein
LFYPFREIYGVGAEKKVSSLVRSKSRRSKYRMCEESEQVVVVVVVSNETIRGLCGGKLVITKHRTITKMKKKKRRRRVDGGYKWCWARVNRWSVQVS